MDARSFRRLAIEESVIVRRIGESDKDETWSDISQAFIVERCCSKFKFEDVLVRDIEGLWGERRTSNESKGGQIRGCLNMVSYRRIQIALVS